MYYLSYTDEEIGSERLSCLLQFIDYYVEFRTWTSIIWFHILSLTPVWPLDQSHQHPWKLVSYVGSGWLKRKPWGGVQHQVPQASAVHLKLENHYSVPFLWSKEEVSQSREERFHLSSSGSAWVTRQTQRREAKGSVQGMGGWWFHSTLPLRPSPQSYSPCLQAFGVLRAKFFELSAIHLRGHL